MALEFAFIRNNLYEKRYSDELKKYIDDIHGSLSGNTDIEKFIFEVIGLAKEEIEKKNYIIASYLFGLIHNFPKESKILDEKQFYMYDFFNFYEHMIDNNRYDILKKIISLLSDYFIKGKE